MNNFTLLATGTALFLAGIVFGVANRKPDIEICCSGCLADLPPNQYMN